MPFGVATKDDRLGERTFGRGFSTGTGKDEQAPLYGAPGATTGSECIREGVVCSGTGVG